MCAVEHRSRAPDAAGRFFSGALQSRGPCISECRLRAGNAEGVASRPGHGGESGEFDTFVTCVNNGAKYPRHEKAPVGGGRFL
jgi:hypothetical protein